MLLKNIKSFHDSQYLKKNNSSADEIPGQGKENHRVVKENSEAFRYCA